MVPHSWKYDILIGSITLSVDGIENGNVVNGTTYWYGDFTYTIPAGIDRVYYRYRLENVT